jgi:type II restriction enzyme
MKYLEVYKKLNLNNNNEDVFNYFINTLNKSIFTWDYFVDFDKIKININCIERELNLLNSLIGKKNIELELIKLIEDYPNVRTVLPLLIAVRNKNTKTFLDIIYDLNIENKDYLFDLRKPLNSKTKKELILFFNKSGLKNIFLDRNIKNVVDYCFGIEVGMDTNARKNRTGTMMEKIIEIKVIEVMQNNKNLDYIVQATQAKIKEKWDFDISIDKSNRRFDFAIFNKIKNKLFVIETNFYKGGGSKLKSTAGEYKSLYSFLDNQNIDLIWITDGQGWLTTKKPLYETFLNNKYLLNLELLKYDVLKEIIFK